MSKEAQTIVTLLDQQYGQLLADARRLAASYIEASMKIYKKTGVCRGCCVNQANEPERVLDLLVQIGAIARAKK
ncbi:hypothetical protein [Pseudomonas putida]|uniref:hypothetical protein n=1 Tax=Pseudomonas putida TaxID=303 RepID=UPI00209C4F79|nr:hypothetical protein [Pseudomonas putida]